jgi:hypothetical protein
MLRALLYLRLTSLRNRVLSQVRRLRQPKYLIGALFAASYFYFFFFSQAPRAANGGGIAPVFGVLNLSSPALILAVAAFALFNLLALMWAAPTNRPGLNFSEAEIAFLFPAPVTRRRLVHYKVLSTQFTALFQSLLYALLFNTSRLFSGDALFIILAWWLILSVVTLHYQASSLTIARVLGDTASSPRKLMISGIALAVIAFVAWSLWREVKQLPPTIDLFNDASLWLPAVLLEGPLHWLFWPFVQCFQPFLARDLVSFLAALPPVLLILAVHYVWVVRLNTAFEERAIAHAERNGARLADFRRSGMLRLGAPRSSGRPDPFRLGRARWAELAFLWKNLLSTSRPWFTPRTWLILVIALIALHIGARTAMGDDYWRLGAALTTLGMFAGGMTLLYGPLITRLDLRQDLANADVLKTYPLPGWRILLGELLTPVAILTGIVWLALLAWILGLTGHEPPKLSPVWMNSQMRIVFTLCAAVLTPFVIALELLIPNAVPLVFPSWFQTLRAPGGGIDLMGQRMIFGIGQVLVVCIALLPAVGTAALLVFILHWALGISPAIAVIAATLAVTMVLIGELWCGLWLLGVRFEKFDLSAEPHP